jgi:hypothetical protein
MPFDHFMQCIGSIGKVVVIKSTEMDVTIAFPEHSHVQRMKGSLNSPPCPPF